MALCAPVVRGAVRGAAHDPVTTGPRRRWSPLALFAIGLAMSVAPPATAQAAPAAPSAGAAPNAKAAGASKAAAASKPTGASAPAGDRARADLRSGRGAPASGGRAGDAGDAGSRRRGARSSKSAGDGAPTMAPGGPSKAGARKVTVDDAFEIEGALDKPSAFFVLNRSDARASGARASVEFVPLVLETAADPLF